MSTVFPGSLDTFANPSPTSDTAVLQQLAQTVASWAEQIEGS